jgi:hypothetical protein
VLLMRPIPTASSTPCRTVSGSMLSGFGGVACDRGSSRWRQTPLLPLLVAAVAERLHPGAGRSARDRPSESRRQSVLVRLSQTLRCTSPKTFCGGKPALREATADGGLTSAAVRRDMSIASRSRI